MSAKTGQCGRPPALQYADIFEIITPAYVTYELSYESYGEWTNKIRRQRKAMSRIHSESMPGNATGKNIP